MSDVSPADLTVSTVSQGTGPLLQRDYQAVLAPCVLTPPQIIDVVAERFPEFSPTLLASFEFIGQPPLAVGDDMSINIPGMGECHVRAIHRDANSLTLRTLEDHFESGRISFGCYESEGKLIFKICSRARVRRNRHLVSFAVGGLKMQEQQWVKFVHNLAEACGTEVVSQVDVTTQEVEANLADLGEIDTPTFVAR